MTLSQAQLEKALERFLASKSLSFNSKESYRYDIMQFVDWTDGQISKEKLKLYGQMLENQAVSVRKRKQSSVNQFLYYLYEHDLVEQFYKLSLRLPVTRSAQKNESTRLDKSILYQSVTHKTGQLLALLIIELGLTPAEILPLEVAQIDLEYKVVSLVRADLLRVLTLPDSLLPYLSVAKQASSDYLFSNKGKIYSRQWLVTQLNAFLAEVDLPDETAKTLREQYILSQRDSGTDILTLAKQLGLKGTATLEKYFKD